MWSLQEPCGLGLVLCAYFQRVVAILDEALASSESPSASMASGKRLLAASVETYWNDEVKEVTKRAGMAETGWSDLRMMKR